MTKFDFLVNLLKCKGVFKAMNEVNCKHFADDTPRPPSEIYKVMRNSFNNFLPSVIVNDPTLERLANQAASELLLDALWNEFCKAYPKAKSVDDLKQPDPKANPVPKPVNPANYVSLNPVGKMSPEVEAIVNGIMGGILNSVLNNSEK